MNFEARYQDLVIGFTHHISRLQLPFVVASGRSASELGASMMECAQSEQIQLPRIYSLTREQSHSMYLSDNPLDPIELLKGILGQSLSNFSEKPQNVNFIDDYTLMGKKAEWMNDRLYARGYVDEYIFTHHVMVARKTRLPQNIEVYEFDTSLAEWIDGRYNSGLVR
jgi:hypothetical protein